MDAAQQVSFQFFKNSRQVAVTGSLGIRPFLITRRHPRTRNLMDWDETGRPSKTATAGEWLSSCRGFSFRVWPGEGESEAGWMNSLSRERIRLSSQY